LAEVGIAAPQFDRQVWYICRFDPESNREEVVYSDATIN
jgi:hypothetical protein